MKTDDMTMTLEGLIAVGMIGKTWPNAHPSWVAKEACDFADAIREERAKRNAALAASKEGDR